MTPDDEPMSDPLLDEVRARRRALFAEHARDLHRLCEAIRRREAEHPDKILDRRKQIPPALPAAG